MDTFAGQQGLYTPFLSLTHMSVETKRKIFFRIFEDRSFIIALVIIVPYIILTYLLVLYLRNIEDFKDVSAIYGAWIGIAIGYFLGSRPVQLLTERIDELLNNIELSREEYETMLKECEKDADELEDDYDDIYDELQHIVVNYKQHLPQELLERLKKKYRVVI